MIGSRALRRQRKLIAGTPVPAPKRPRDADLIEWLEGLNAPQHAAVVAVLGADDLGVWLAHLRGETVPVVVPHEVPKAAEVTTPKEPVVSEVTERRQIAAGPRLTEAQRRAMNRVKRYRRGGADDVS